MFGKRGNDGFGKGGSISPVLQPAISGAGVAVAERTSAPVLAEPVRETMTVSRTQPSPPPVRKKAARTEDYYDTKSQVFSALIDTIDLSQLAKLDNESAREGNSRYCQRHHHDQEFRDVDLRAGGAA